MKFVLVGLEVWLLATAVAAATPKPQSEALPPLELLEFLGDWTAEEQKLIDQAAAPKKKPAARRTTRKHEGNESETRNGPPR